MSEKILSIIVPSYNMEKYLPKCLGSLVVAPELMERLEVLVVNDGSKDRTGEIAHEFAAKWPNTFKAIDKANGNYGSCINAALPVVNGRFVKILDADDSFDLQAFPDFLIALENMPNDTDMVMNDFVKVDESETLLETVNYSLSAEDVVTPDDLVRKKCSMAMHAVSFRTEILRDINYRQTEGISYTDTEWIYLPVAASKTIRYVNRPIYRYLVGRSGQTVERSIWIKNRHMLDAICDGMFAQYERCRGHSRYSAAYLEFQLARIISLLLSMYIYQAPLESALLFLTKVDRLRSRHPFLRAVLSEMVLFSKLLAFFHYADFLLDHQKMRRSCLRMLRLYAQIRGWRA